MKKHLYKACLNAGLTKNQVSKIEDAYDEERKRLKRENKAMEKLGVTVTMISTLESMGNMLERIQEKASLYEETPYETAVRNERYDILDESLRNLAGDDRAFMMALYFEEDGNVSRMARRMGIPRETVRDRNIRILRELNNFFEKRGYSDASF